MKKNGVIKFNKLIVNDYDLDKTLNSGQTFCWKKIDGVWYGSTINGLLVLKQDKKGVIKWQTFPKQNNKAWVERYLRTNFNYRDFVKSCDSDTCIKNALSEFCGLRILGQDFAETIISFIISANNNISAIKKSINKLSRLFGRRIKVGGIEFFLFPEMKQLAGASIKQLRSCSLGYKASYVKETAQSLCKISNWNQVMRTDEDTVRKSLLALRGVGPKVADCILCYSLGYDNVTPLDVWGQRILVKYYGVNRKFSYQKMRDWTQENFYGYAAWVGQYLFEYIRNIDR